MSVRVEGLKELDKALKDMATSTAKRTAKRAMATALEPVAAAARELAPRDTGRLAESIAVSDKLTKRQRTLARGSEGRDMVTMNVGAHGRVAHLVEFGTGPRHKKNGAFVGVMPPQPFMRPAWDQNMQGVLDSLAASLSAEIAKTVARAERRAARRAAKAAGGK